MTADAPFLRAIIAEPDDDLPRLVYADWLEEHGDPERAEFVRIQCELASLNLRPHVHLYLSRGHACNEDQVTGIICTGAGVPVNSLVDWSAEWIEPLRPGRYSGVGVLIHVAQNRHGLFAQIIPTEGERQDAEREHAAALRRREQELWNHDGNNMKWLPPVLAYAYLRDDTSMPTGTSPPLWTFKRGFVSEFVSTWEKWARNADAILAACPIAGSRDGLVRLTDAPREITFYNETEKPMTIGKRLFQTMIPPLSPFTIRPEPWNHSPELMKELAECRWPGVQFELPPVVWAGRTAGATWESSEPVTITFNSVPADAFPT